MPAVRGKQRAALREAQRAPAHFWRVDSDAPVARAAGEPPQAKPAGGMRSRATLGAVAIGAFVIGILVAILGGLPATRQPTGGEWVVQLGLLIAVTLMLVVRLRRKG
jgi:hypothetical protein